MNITISAVNTPSYTSFNGRTVPPKDVVNKTLSPLWKTNPSVEFLVKESGYSVNLVNIWIKETFGKSAAKVIKGLKEEQLKKQLIEYKKSGMSDEEVAKAKGMSIKWVKEKLSKLNIIQNRKNKIKLLDENMPWMLQAGYTVSKIVKSLEVGRTMISNWVHANTPEGITMYRHNNHIDIWHNYENTHVRLNREMKEHFDNGGNIKDALKKFKMSPPTLYRYLNIFDISPRLRQGKNLMKQNLEQMMQERKSIREMAEEFNISEATVRREIIKTYGKNYREIKHYLG